MFNINDNMLLDRAANYASFVNGKKYYKEGRVYELRSNEKREYFQGTVRGSLDYQVSVKFDHTGELMTSYCTCPAYNQYKGYCKHIIALLICIMKLDLSKDMMEKDEGSVRNIISFYRHRNEIEKTPINIEYNYEFSLNSYDGIERASYLNLRIGEDKLYVVKSMKNFFEKLEYGEEIEFGKNFTFSPYKHTFRNEDKKVINFLSLLYENYKENYSGYNNQSIFRNRRMLLTPTALKRFFNLMEGRNFNTYIMNEKYENTTIIEKSLPLNMEVTGGKTGLIIKMDCDEDVIPLTSDGKYFFSSNKIYKLPEDQRNNIIPLYDEIIFKRNGTLKITDNYKETFISEVLPSVKNSLNLSIDKKIEEAIYNPELECEIYLDKQEDIIEGKIKFIYGNIVINPFSSKEIAYKDKKTILLRDVEKERYILELLEESEFKVLDGIIYMDREEKIFDFVYDIIPKLQDYCKIYYSDSLKNLNIRDSSYFSGGISLANNWDMLEFDFEIEGIDISELDEVFKSLKEKKKYFRLKDGSFLALDNRELEHMGNIVEYLGISKKDFEKEAILIPKFRAIYLDKYLKENNLDFVKKNINFRKLVQDINEPEEIQYEIPEELQNVLRGYQKFGFKWLKTLSQYGFGGILADDMGLGKTLQIITFLLSEKNEKGQSPSIVIVPTSLVYNWEAEAHKFAPSLKILVVTGSKAERSELINEVENYDIVITSYPLIRKDIELYKDLSFRYCILDEAQHIKNYKSLNSESVKKINASNYFALTGTPMENSLIELWSIFDFLMPGYLLSNGKFIERYEKPIFREQDNKALKDLNNHIKPFILRRLKKDVLKELPEKIEQKVLVEMTMEQKKLYLAYLKAIKGEIEEEIAHNGFGRSHIKILSGLTRLRQICCHPETFITDYKGESGKLNFLEEVLVDAIEGGHRILVFSQFTSMLNIIKEMLDDKNIEYMYLDGSTEIKQRGNLVRDFNEGIGSVFLISLKAGGTGLNLTGADMVIHYDPWWNPAVEDQATDRAYRIGQKNTVQVMKLITKGTIEEKIFNLQERKKEMIDKVITEGETLVSKLSEDEIRFLFDLKPND
jgi:SNF2 family DNA or RNA helicase